MLKGSVFYRAGRESLFLRLWRRAWGAVQEGAAGSYLVKLLMGEGLGWVEESFYYLNLRRGLDFLAAALLCLKGKLAQLIAGSRAMALWQKGYFLGLVAIPLALPLLPNMAFLLLLAAVLGIFVLALLTHADLSLRLPDNPYLYLFVLLLILGSVTSVTLGFSLRELVLHFLGWGLMVAIFSSLTQGRRVEILLFFLSVGAVLVSLYGIYGY